MRTFVAELLIVPSGLLVAALLTRRLPLEDYGLFTLALTFVTWIQWSLNSLFTRSSVGLVSRAKDAYAYSVGATVLRTYAASGTIVALLVIAGADFLADFFREPRLAAPLRVLALDIPLFCIAQAHRNILIGMHRFRARASVSAMRWISRAALIALFVMGGWGMMGALLGALGASICEIVVCRRALPISWRRSDFPSRSLWEMAFPLLACGLALRLFDKIDLFMLSARAVPAASSSAANGSVASGSAMVAIYGGAQNLALVPGLFTMAFAPTLLASMARAQRENDAARVQQQAWDSLRAIFLLAPVAAAISMSAPALLQMFFGQRFTQGALVLSLLIWSATTIALITICNTLLLLKGILKPAVAILLPLPLLSLLVQWFVVPRFAMTGAASATLFLALCCATVHLLAVQKWCRFPLPWPTIKRSFLTCVVIAIAGTSTRTSGRWSLVEFVFLLVLAFIFLTVLGEWEIREREWLRSVCKTLRLRFFPQRPEEIARL